VGQGRVPLGLILPSYNTRVKAFRGFLFRSASLLSLLLLLASLWAWFNSRLRATYYDTFSHWIEDGRLANSSRWIFASSDGAFGVYRARFHTDAYDYIRYYRRMMENELHGGARFTKKGKTRHGPPEPLGLPGLDGKGPFAWETWEITPGAARTTYHAASAPYWALSLVASVLPAAWIVRFQASRRIPPGHCRACGYDLRASPDRCPECGRTV
jgi:hypothetical protein